VDKTLEGNKMITIEQTENLVNIAVMGEFTIADFKAFEEQSLYKLKTPGAVNLLFDLRAMINYTVDVAWEEIKFFSREHNHDFNKIAVVTDDQWITWQAWLSRIFVDADIRVFTGYEAATTWVQETPD
jgi:SpoIIAA-like